MKYVGSVKNFHRASGMAFLPISERINSYMASATRRQLSALFDPADGLQSIREARSLSLSVSSIAKLVSVARMTLASHCVHHGATS
jgi:hypothetical protein